MNCIVHYKKQTSYATLKTLGEQSIERIREAKTKRKKIGGTHGHDEQCSKITPDQINFELHGVHLEPCCKRYLCLIFTFISYCIFPKNE